MSQKWTDDEIDTLTVGYTLSWPIKKIARLLGRSKPAVMGKANRLGISWGVEDDEQEGREILDGMYVEIYTANMNESLDGMTRPIVYLKGTNCDWCPHPLKEDFWGYGRWSFDTKKCAKAHLRYEQEHGPCHSDKVHQSHDGNDNHMVGMVAPVGQVPGLIPYLEDPMNKRPRRDVSHQKSTYKVIGHSDPALSTECDCEPPNHCEKCEEKVRGE